MLRSLFLIIIFSFIDSFIYGQEPGFSDSILVGKIIIEGNHVTSKKVIYRELAFKIDNYVGRNELEYLKNTSVNNLVKTALFIFVDLNIDENQTGVIIVTVKLTERWFIWPTAYFNQNDRNFSEWWRTKDSDKLEYGVGLKVNNFRGMGESIILNYRFGNITQYEMEYNEIRLNSSERHLLSVKVSYSTQNSLPWIIESNQLLNLKAGSILMRNTSFTLKYKYRKEFFNSHSVGFGYSDDKIADTILLLNPNFFGLNNNKQRYLSLEYEFARDTRDSHIYPKTGLLFVAGIKKDGLGILPGEYNSMDVKIQLFGYRKLCKRFYAASGFLFTLRFNHYQDFYTQTGLGYLQFVRGYEYYAVKGDDALLFKNLLKFELLQKRIINLKIWPIRRVYQLNRIPFEIYSNVFFDAGYVNDKSEIYKLNNNTLVNKLMYSTGIGFDFTTYYDKVLRLDYSINALGETGFFIHWKAAIR